MELWRINETKNQKMEEETLTIKKNKKEKKRKLRWYPKLHSYPLRQRLMPITLHTYPIVAGVPIA